MDSIRIFIRIFISFHTYFIFSTTGTNAARDVLVNNQKS